MSHCLLSDGRQFFYREAGSGKVLLLLHGWSMSSAVFQEVMKDLSKDYRVLAPDLSGHGASDAAGINYSIDSLSADIEEWLSLLEIDTIYVLGWSLGGQVALQLVFRSRVLIEKLILVATTPLFISTADWQHGMSPTQVRAMDRQIQRDYRRSMGEFFKLMFDGEEMSTERYLEIIDFAVREGSLPEREISRNGLKILGKNDLRQFLADIKLPVLIHYGELDLITVPAACRFLADQIQGARKVGWSGVGHAPFLSRPDEAVALWRGFLQ